MSKFFLNPKKNRAVQNQIRTISCSEEVLPDEKEINTELFKLYKGLFESKINVSNALIKDCLNSFDIPKLTKKSNCKNLKW